MNKKKLYFLHEDSCECNDLSELIKIGEENQQDTITLYEAIYDDVLNKENAWCGYHCIMVEKSECNRTCSMYQNSGGRFCDLRGKLYLHGESVTFNVKTCKKIK